MLFACILGTYVGNELNSSRIADGVISFKNDFYALFRVVDVSLRLAICAVCFSVSAVFLENLINARSVSFLWFVTGHTLISHHLLSLELVLLKTISPLLKNVSESDHNMPFWTLTTKSRIIYDIFKYPNNWNNPDVYCISISVVMWSVDLRKIYLSAEGTSSECSK